MTKAVVCICVTLYSLLSGHAIAESITEEEKETVYGMADKLSVCGGDIYAASEIMKILGKENAAAEITAQANGRHMAATWLLYSSGVMSNWQNATKYAEQLAISEKQKILAAIELSDNSSEEFTNISKLIEKCQELDEYQIELVGQLRRFMYEKSEQIGK